MKAVWSFTAVLSLQLALSAAALAQESSADEAAIRTNCDKYVEAYNRRDARTMAAMWLPEAIYMDRATGDQVVGRDAIAKHFDDIFAGSEEAKLKVTIESIDFVSPNVAIEKGAALVTYAEFDPEETIYSAVHVKRDGKWLLDRISEEEVAAPTPSHYEQLQELEWLVGSWIDSDELVTIESEVAWTKNRNFLRRSFSVAVRDEIDMTGIQVIGWDPAAQQVRSWVFDSDGGFADAMWTRKGDQWFIQNNGTLSDGRKATSLNILTYVDGDSFKWESTNREVDGELLPNVAAVVVVRALAADVTDVEQQ
jgi:uncharacterized protein (TIGR02246 family)